MIQNPIDGERVQTVLARRIHRAQTELDNPLFPDAHAIWKNKLFSYMEIWEDLWPGELLADYLKRNGSIPPL